jgi:hypothetical protein
MPKPLPPIDPGLQAKIDQFHGSCVEILDRYVAGFETDMNRHAVKHGPMDETRAHNDLTRIYARQVASGELPVNMVCGLLAEAVLRGIAAKKKGKG